MSNKNEKILKISVKEINFNIFAVFKKDYKDKYCEAYTVTTDEPTKRPTIYFNASEIIPLSIIVHELYHAILHDLKLIGHTDLGNPNSETVPYLMGSCTEKTVNYCKKHKIKIDFFA